MEIGVTGGQNQITGEPIIELVFESEDGCIFKGYVSAKSAYQLAQNITQMAIVAEEGTKRQHG